MYPSLRNIHLICGALSLPALLLYAVSAVQMAHSKWFTMKPAVAEENVSLSPGYTDGRRIAHDLMGQGKIEGAINRVQQTPTGFNINVQVPGRVHEIRYDMATGATRVRTSVAGFMGMMNRLHHAGGLYHDYAPLKVWGVLVGIVSLATVGLGITGLWMWWLRRQERVSGLVLLGANLVYAAVVLTMIRSYGP